MINILIDFLRRIVGGSSRSMQRRTARVGDKLSRSVSRGNTTTGNLSGEQTIRQLRRDAKTFRLRELLDDKAVLQALKKMRRARNKLKKYTSNYLGTLELKYSSKPRILDFFLLRIAKAFTQYFAIFQTNFSTVITRTNDMLVKEAQQLADLNAAIANILQSFVEKDKKERVLIPEETIRHAHKQITHLFEQKIADYVKESREEKRVAQGKNIGFITTSSVKAMKKVKRIINKIRRKEEQDLRETLIKIREELGHGVDQDYLSLLEKHVKNQKTLENLHFKLHHDIMLVLLNVKDDLEIMLSSTKTFYAMFQNNSVVRSANLEHNIHLLEEDFAKLGKTLDADYLDAKRLYFQVKTLDERCTQLFSELETISKSIEHDLQRQQRARLAA